MLHSVSDYWMVGVVPTQRKALADPASVDRRSDQDEIAEAAKQFGQEDDITVLRIEFMPKTILVSV